MSLVGVLLGMTLAVREVGAMVIHPESAVERCMAFLAEADAAMVRSDYPDAIAKYRAAYYGLPRKERGSYMGSLPVRGAMRAYQASLSQREDRSSLERAHGLVSEFLEAVAHHAQGEGQVGPDVVEELDTIRADLEERLDRLDEAARPPSLTPTTLPSAPASDAGPERSPRDLLGIGLLAGGSGLVGAGVAISVGWWTIRRNASSFLDDNPTLAMSTEVSARVLQHEEDRAKQFLIGGIVSMGIGAAMAIAGGIHMLIHRRKQERMPRMGLTIHPTHAGITLFGRF